MVLLATGKFCEVQAVKVGKTAYGLQGHIELTPNMFDDWINQDGDLVNLDKNHLRNDYTAVQEEYESNARKLFTNFLKIAGLLKEN